MNELIDQMVQAMPMGTSGRSELESMMDNLPIITFFSQWIYCFLYGTVLASIMSRYIFLQKLFGGPFPPKESDTPDDE